MTERSDALIIGGGIIGLSVAFRLCQADLSVTILERGGCGCAASWAAAGIIAPGNPHRSDHLYAIHCESIDRYPSFCGELQDISGIDPQYTRCGALRFLTTEQFVQMGESDIRVTAERTTDDGLPVLELLTTDQCRKLEPSVTGEALAIMQCRTTAQVRNPRLLRALRTACTKLGVTIRENTPVASLTVEKRRVTGARTHSEYFTADRTVLCAGAWSSQFVAPDLADLIPVHPVKGQIILLDTVANLPEPRDSSRAPPEVPSDDVNTHVPAKGPPFSRVIHKRHTYLVPRNDGKVLLGATIEPDAGFDKRNTAQAVNSLMTDAIIMVPCIAQASVAAMWSGFRPGTPDGRPHIGPVPGHQGLIAATGHYRSGLALAPITADIVRDLIVHGKTSFELDRCAPGRKFPGP
ncbi:MAG: glycine oxidase ThiO [Phycisphaerae bacterium]